MATNPNAMFYKTAPYLYAKDFNLNSVLDGLTGYKIVSGETEAILDSADDGGVFGEIKPREKPKMHENKYFTRHVNRKPAKYNPYARTTETTTTKAYRPDNYRAVYGQAGESEENKEGGESGVDDFFGLTEPQKSIRSTSAFPGYQPYSEESSITAKTLNNHNVQTDNDDDLPSPSWDQLPGGDTDSSSSSSFSLVGYGYDDETTQKDEDEDDSNLDFYQQLESLAHGGKGTTAQKSQTNKNGTQQALKVGRSSLESGQERLRLPEQEQEKWNYSSHKYQARATSLGTYKCWKCKRVGHLPEDCTAFLGVAAPTADNPNVMVTPLPSHLVDGKASSGIYSGELKRLHLKCKEIGAKKGDKCGECGARANLAQCLDCGVVVCDNKSHLIRHLRNNPSHNMLYSYKLRRQIKCCKTTCNVTNVRELFACAQCLEKCFDRHYSMMNAAWSGKGIKYIPNAICCDDHFEWHRINCVNARPGYSGTVVDSSMLDDPSLGGQLSEYLF